MINMKMRIITIVLTLAMLLMLTACGGQGAENPTQSGLSGEPGTEQPSAAPGEIDDTHRTPTDEEIRALLEDGDVVLFWAVEEGVFSPETAISVYKVEQIDGDAIWNAIFSQDDLVSEQRVKNETEILEFTINLDGIDYTGRLWDNTMEFSGLSGLPAALSPERLLPALSSFAGMDWGLAEAEDKTEHVFVSADEGEIEEAGISGFDSADWSLVETEEKTDYYAFVDGIKIDQSGYGVGETAIAGPLLLLDPSYVSIYIPFRLGEKEDALEASDLISSELAETLCRADLTVQAGRGNVTVIDHAELVYYYQAQQKKLLPAWRITGTSHSLYEGEWISAPTTRLIDAQTGELYW